MRKKKLAIVILLLGRYEVQVRQLDRAIKAIDKLSEDVQVILSADSKAWIAAPQLQMFVRLNKNVDFCYSENDCIVPAAAMNRGLEFVNADYIQFALLEDPFVERSSVFLNKIEDKAGECAFYFEPDISNSKECAATVNEYGWSQTTNIGIGLGALCVPIEVVHRIGKIDENPILGSEVERWYALAVSRNTNLISVGVEQENTLRLYEYPSQRHRYLSNARDLAIRYAVYTNGIAAANRSLDQWASDFEKDLNSTDRKVYEQITGICPPAHQNIKNREPYKIMIVGGCWEYHHNQICFFNYLEYLYGRGFATYRPVLEHTMSPEMVIDYDLVIFTRCRSKQAIAAIQKCNERGIASLYMIDDNWLTIAEDHPEHGSIFVPGNEQYDNFIEAVGLCDAVGYLVIC